MSLPILISCKKRKRAPKLFGLSAFCDPGNPIQPNGSFRDNIRDFLQECAVIEEYKVDHNMSVWCTLLLQENTGIVLPLYTIQQNVDCSQTPFCDQCRCCGWSHNYMSKRKYHLIIPHDLQWNKPLSSDVLDLQSHLLHGVIHCNGYGHLLCINGIEGGSKYLCGREIMDLWDRICTNLHVRKITVEDSSKKRSMDLRLLHAIAYGHPWFGRWGYKFCLGSFGVQEHHYQKAVDVISNFDVDELVGQLQKTTKTAGVKQIIVSYKNFSQSNLTTLRDLLKFMLSLSSQAPAKNKIELALARTHAATSRPIARSKSFAVITRPLKSFSVRSNQKPTKSRKFAALVASMDSRWPKRRLEFTAEVIVNALKENKESKSNKNGMTRQEVRDAARAHIGDTGLLDYVLKSMNNVTVGDYNVQRRIDPVNRVLEYTIHDVREGSISPKKPCKEKAATAAAPVSTPSTVSSGTDIYKDVHILYKHLLLNLPEPHISGLSTKVILDSKHLVKEWPFRDADDQLLRYVCHVLPCSSEADMELPRNRSPGELIVLPLYASVGDLKSAAQHALRDTYCTMKNVVVDSIAGLENLNDDDAVFGAIESGSEIWVRGSGIDIETEFRYEGGPDNWVVRCSCGATDDDGERMVSCDICEAWQHTRCIGIEDTEAVPPLFVCQKCCSSLMPPRIDNKSFLQNESFHDMLLPLPLQESWMTSAY